jgi:hypothetical protein
MADFPHALGSKMTKASGDSSPALLGRLFSIYEYKLDPTLSINALSMATLLIEM